MSLPRVLILHGLGGSGPGHWQRWLADELRALGATVLLPDLPDPDAPDAERWARALHDALATLADGSGTRVVAAHSLGSVLWVREAARVATAHRVDRVALVAPPSPGPHLPGLGAFFAPGPDPRGLARAAAHTRLVCGDSDPYCPSEPPPAAWGPVLHVPVDVLPGACHVNTEAGYGPWPAMRRWCLGEATRLDRAQAAAGPKNGAEM